MNNLEEAAPMKVKPAVARPTAVLAVLAAVVATGIVGASLSHPATASHPSAVPPPATSSVPRAAISHGAIHDVAAQGVIISLVSPSDNAQKLTSTQAVSAAARSFGFVNDGKTVGVSLARLTDDHYGKQLEPDPNKPSRIDPVVKDRLVWIVEFKGFTPFVSGPLGSERSTPPAPNGHMLAAVDVASGDVVWGTQY